MANSKILTTQKFRLCRIIFNLFHCAKPLIYHLMNLINPIGKLIVKSIRIREVCISGLLNKR